MRCPKCKREISSFNWQTAGKFAIGLGVAFAGFMVAGPIGAAAGGGLVGKMAQTATRRGTKALINEICDKYTCPYCGHSWRK